MSRLKGHHSVDVSFSGYAGTELGPIRSGGAAVGFTLCRFCGDRRLWGPPWGLCLAVALSHVIDRPLLSAHEPSALIVDDVYETGRTLQALKGEVPQASFAVWVSKVRPDWWVAAEVAASSEWLVFPWENLEQARADEQAYRASRGL